MRLPLTQTLTRWRLLIIIIVIFTTINTSLSPRVILPSRDGGVQNAGKKMLLRHFPLDKLIIFIWTNTIYFFLWMDWTYICPKRRGVMVKGLRSVQKISRLSYVEFNVIFIIEKVQDLEQYTTRLKWYFFMESNVRGI